MKRILIALITFLLLTSLASAATLQVGPKLHYKTIQSAVNAAQSGDTIYVNAGAYKETVTVDDKYLIFQGQKNGNKYLYPSVYGFDFSCITPPGEDTEVGKGDINGFKIIKTGIHYEMIGHNIVRNDYFTNCGVFANSQTSGNNVIMNNQFTNGGIDLSDECFDNVVIGNKITNAVVGLGLYGGASCSTITKNTFSHCQIGVALYQIPSCLIGNTYIKNKINIKTGVY